MFLDVTLFTMIFQNLEKAVCQYTLGGGAADRLEHRLSHLEVTGLNSASCRFFVFVFPVIAVLPGVK